MTRSGFRIAQSLTLILTLALSALILGRAEPASAATFTVINTNDAGPGSLRQAILDANGNPGADTITFNIPGAGPHSIQPTSALPPVTDPVIIDGYTQTGASPNTNGPGLGSNAVLMIELDGTNGGSGRLHGLQINAAGSTLRGLVINRFSGNGVMICCSGATGNLVQGNFLGTDVTGSVDLGNLVDGVQIRGAANNTIGGITAEARNVISGNDVRGISIQGSVDTTGNLVLGNFIGTDITGTVAVGNSQEGVVLRGTPGNTIGGTLPGARNLISGNRGGVLIKNIPSLGVTGASQNLVEGNFIGTDVTGTANLGNGIGVIIEEASDNTIGGTVSGAGNTIAFNHLGVLVISGTGNAILRNSIFSNRISDVSGLGIGFERQNVTLNDVGDGDTGANNLQNFPVLSSAQSNGGIVIKGTLNSTLNTVFRLEFFANGACDPSGHGEGERFLGSTTVATDSSGNVGFTVGFPISGIVGQQITATATDPGNSTSEFSQCIVVEFVEPPPPGMGIAGTLPASGFGLVTFGGTIEQLRDALATACPGGRPIFATSGGQFVAFFPTVSIAAVNAHFNARFPGGVIPIGTPLIGGNCALGLSR